MQEGFFDVGEQSTGVFNWISQRLIAENFRQRENIQFSSDILFTMGYVEQELRLTVIQT